MKKKVLIILFVIQSFQLVNAQHHLGFDLSPGLSQFIYDIDYITNGNIKHKIRFSGKAGIFYYYQKNHLSFGTEISFIQIEGKNILSFDLYDNNGVVYGQANDNLFWHISYLGLPIKIGYSIEKSSFFLGYRFAYDIKKISIEKGSLIDQNGQLYEWENKSEDFNLKPDHGIYAGASYNINPKWNINFSLYYGIQNIFDGYSALDWKWRNQQVTFGVSYSILKQNKNTE